MALASVPSTWYVPKLTCATLAFPLCLMQIQPRLGLPQSVYSKLGMPGSIYVKVGCREHAFVVCAVT